MKTLKFVAADESEKRFEVDLRKRVNTFLKENNLSTKGGVRMFFKALIMLSIYITPLVLLLTVNMPLWADILLIVVMGVGEAGIGMSVMHDAAHGAFSKRNWVNKLFASSIVLLGSNTINWKIQHNIMHHTYTNIMGYDPDIESRGNIRLCEHSPLKSVQRFQHIYAFFLYGLMTLARFVMEIGILRDYSKQGIIQAQGLKPGVELFKVVVIKIIYLGVFIGLPIIFTDYTWWQVLIGFVILHFTAGAIMSTVFQMAHVVEGAVQPLPDENGVIHHAFLVHQLMATSDFARHNSFLEWYVGGLNFQIEHHLFPNVCHLNYRKIAPIVEATAKEYGLHYNLKPTFMAAFASHTKRLKELGRFAHPQMEMRTGETKLA